MWVIDIRHWLDDKTQTGQAVPQLKFKVKRITEIIAHATSFKAGLSVDSPTICWRRPKRKPFKGQLDIQLSIITDQIHWICPVCEDEGVVTGQKGLIWDLSEHPERWC